MKDNTNCIRENWSKIINEYNKLLRRRFLIKKYDNNLNKGTTDEQIKKAEQVLGLQINFRKELKYRSIQVNLRYFFAA